VKLVAEMLFYPGSDDLRKLIVRPKRGAHAPLVETMAGTDRDDGMIGLFTWIRTQSCLHNDINKLPAGSTTRNMMQDMINAPSGRCTFQQQYTFFDLFLSQPEKAHEFVNVCPTNPLYDEIRDIAHQFRDRLMTVIADGHNKDEILAAVLEGLQVLEEYDMTGEQFYALEMAVCGDPELIAEGTERVLPKIIKNAEDSRKKALVLIEYKHKDSLEKHKEELHLLYFNKTTLVGNFVRGVEDKLGCYIESRFMSM
jgi:hypothetical protein